MFLAFYKILWIGQMIQLLSRDPMYFLPFLYASFILLPPSYIISNGWLSTCIKNFARIISIVNCAFRLLKLKMLIFDLTPLTN